MKIAARILSLLVIVSLAAFYTACDNGGDPEKSEIDQQIEKLNGTWTVSAATFNGGAPDLDHSGMVLTISGTTGNTSVSFTVSGRPAGPSAWPPNGSLAFGETNVKTTLTRDDGIVVTYSVAEKSLSIDFDFNISPYTSTGKAKTVDGQWHFEFTKP